MSLKLVPQPSARADRALVGASVRTLDPALPFATALAWRDGVLIAVGGDEEIREVVGPDTEVLDGTGMAVVPGLVDAHIHPFHGTLMTRGVDLRETRTLDEVRALLATEAARLGPGDWVVGHSIRYEPFHESGIRADDIEEALGGRPALLRFYDGHSALASRAALDRAGVDGARDFPQYAEVVCDPDGTPTGALLEAGAIDLVQSIVPKLSEDEQLDAYAATMRALNAVGLTGAHAMLGDPALLDVCRRLEERGDFTLRMSIPMHQAPDIGDERVAEHLGAHGQRGRRWRTGTAKFFLDGVLDSGTGWLVDPGPGGTNATPFWPSLERYRELVARFTEHGFSCVTHAVGDGAVRATLDAYQAAGPPARGMHRVEHLETCTDEDLPRFAQLNVAASMQPLHLEGLDEPDVPSSWIDGLSPGRRERGFRCADVLAAGAVLPLGSDWMVADYDPRVGMAWARLRRKPGATHHTPFLREQALTAEQALLGYTRWAAATEGPDAGYGVLAPGLAADVTVLAADPVDTSADEVPHIPVHMTIVDGELVHRTGV